MEEAIEMKFRPMLGQHIAICGSKGTGKTSLAQHIVLSMQAKNKFIFHCKPEDRQIWVNPKTRRLLPNVNYYQSKEQLLMMLRMLQAKGGYHDSIIFVDDQQSIVDFGSRGEYPPELGFFIINGRATRTTVILNLHWLRRFPATLRGEIDWWIVGRPGLMDDGMLEDIFGRKSVVIECSKSVGKYQFCLVNNFDRVPRVVGPVSKFTPPTGASPQDIDLGGDD